MKQQFVISTLALALLILFAVGPSGCTYDSGIILPPDIDIDTTVQVSFTGDVLPLFDQSCNYSGCHATGDVPPDLTATNAYVELFEGGYIDTIAPIESELMQWMLGNRDLDMPLTGPDEEINKTVLTWITQGAKDN